MANKKTKVKFLQSPSGAPFNLAYHHGDITEVDSKLAAEMIEAGVCEAVEDGKTQAPN